MPAASRFGCNFRRVVSQVQFLNKACIFLNVLKPQLWLFTHQTLDQVAGFTGFILINADPYQFAAAWIHCSLFQILGVHFTKTFKAADVDFPLATETFSQPSWALKPFPNGIHGYPS